MTADNLASREYEALRAEMLQWQNRRFAVLTATIAIVIGLLGLEGVLKDTSPVGWWLISSLLWFFLGSSAALTWYAGRANTKLAAYLLVFHEHEAGGWEARLQTLRRSGLDWFNLDRMVFLIYLGLAVLAALVPGELRGYETIEPWQGGVLVVSGIWATALAFLLLLDKPMDSYCRRFREIAARPREP